MAYSEKIKAEAVRLRTDENLGLANIASRLGISKGTASLWLREHPLSQEVVQARMVKNGLESGPRLRKPRGQESKFHKMIAGRVLAKHQKGKIAETAVALRLVLHDLDLYGSVFDGDKYDWLVGIPATGVIQKVQVRWVREGSTGLPNVDLCCSNGRGKHRRYKPGEFDFIIGYDLYTDTCYVWSWNEVEHLQRSVTICPEAAERWDKILVGSAIDHTL